MKSDRNIFIAFLLNLLFSVFELIGGVLTGSVAIVSDAVHDMADAASIGASFFLERKSKQKPDGVYTYGYGRYSVVGSLITTAILLLGSGIMIINAVRRIIHPVEIHYTGMLIFAVVGVCVNLLAALVTREGGSLNQKAVNLHMLEDVLGWLVVLVGAVIMHFVDLPVLDPAMSLLVSVFILVNAIGNLKEIMDIILEKTPKNICMREIKEQLREVDGVLEVHHIHLWTLDGQNHCATLHVVTDRDFPEIKAAVRKKMQKLGIEHLTVETERAGEQCHNDHCHIHPREACHHHHHTHSYTKAVVKEPQL